MNLGLILSLIKLGLEVFQNERKDMFLKKYLRLQKEYQDELNKGLDDRSDLKLDQLRIEAILLAELVVRERNSSK
jgi:hypothetical protein